ncbi:hypothetical protein NQ315_015351, partial [Exocentrus adspersus]
CITGKYSAVLSENRAGNNSKILLSSDSEEDIIVIDTKKSAVDILTIEDSESIYLLKELPTFYDEYCDLGMGILSFLFMET